MLKKTLINNLIALSLYVGSIALFIVLLFVAETLITPTDETLVVIACIVIILYVFCGFILKPVGKFSFLSVLSVAFSLVIALVISYWRSVEGGTFFYFFINPIAGADVDLYFLPHLQTTTLILSPICPPLLMYLGMVIRKRVIRHRLQKSHKSDT